jgi:hypothetical protein
MDANQLKWSHMLHAGFGSPANPYKDCTPNGLGFSGSWSK